MLICYMLIWITVGVGIRLMHKPAYFTVTEVYYLKLMQEFCKKKILHMHIQSFSLVCIWPRGLFVTQNISCVLVDSASLLSLSARTTKMWREMRQSVVKLSADSFLRVSIVS